MRLGPRLILAALLGTLVAGQPREAAPRGHPQGLLPQSAPSDDATPIHEHVRAHPEKSLAAWSSGVEETAAKSQKCQRAAHQHPPDCAAIHRHCAEYGSGLVGYVELYYCAYSSWQPAMLLWVALFLGLLFVWLGVSASEYFSPNISTLAALLRLPESLAGVTLLALGNGAPDLFSTFSAVRAGSGALAIGQLVGSASFIVGIVAPATTFIVPRYKVSRLSYLREVIFFTATAAIVSAIVLAEKLTHSLALCMVGLYVAYVLTVMLTTFYEEQCRDLGLATEDDWLSAVPPQQAQPAPDVSSRPPIARLHSRSYGALPLICEGAGRSAYAGSGIANRRASSIFGYSSTGAISVIGPRRRQTINIPHSRLDCRACANGDVCGSSLAAANNSSARALGGFLHRHRKSLLAVAECQDILSEIHGSSGRTDHVADIAEAVGRDASLAFSNVSAERLSYPYDADAPTEHTSIAAAAAKMTTAATCAPVAPPPWNDYKMQPTCGHSLRSFGSRSPLPIDQDASDITSDSASNCLQITPKSPLTARQTPSLFPATTSSSQTAPSLATPNPNFRRTEYLSPAFCNRSPHSTSQPLSLSSPSSPSSPSRLPASAKRPRPGAVSTSDKSPRLIASSAHTDNGVLASQVRCQTPNSVSIVDMLATLPGSPLSTHEPRYASGQEIRRPDGVYSSSGEKAISLAYACIPTLHYWRRDASKSLKLFIAVSAVPVLMLTLTVPVLKEMPPAKAEHPSGQSRSSTSDRVDGSASEEGVFPNDVPCLLSVSRSPSLRSQQVDTAGTADTADTALPSCHKSPLVDSSSAMEWGTKMASYLRSAISVPFLFAALKINGYHIQAISAPAQATAVCAISAMVLIGNYIARHSASPPHWLLITPCFVGFVCGLAWVYIVANEIVSITQALGVILNLSEEIMGLTVVGFGNSLGDLVTNLTLTRMGYPMMAISACFGGPMLCLLLGVGVAAFTSFASGEISGGAYWIPLTSPTVLVSTACLLLNSALFLFVVPRQSYYMTRAVGSMAMFVYLVGMILNVYLVT